MTRIVDNLLDLRMAYSSIYIYKFNRIYMEKEWDEEVISNEQFRKETDEVLERNKKYLVQEMMGEQYDKYFWDEKHAL